MFAALRRAWQRYLASLPPSDDPEPLTDAQIIRQDFREPPVDPAQRQAFANLAREVLAHLPDPLRSSQHKRLTALLKPGVSPAEAVFRWADKVCSPTGAPVGVIVLDWKARDEVQWQAERLCQAHGVTVAWRYDHPTDTDWPEAFASGAAPVKAPLARWAMELAAQGLQLLVLEEADTVVALALPLDRAAAVRGLAQTLGLALATLPAVKPR